MNRDPEGGCRSLVFGAEDLNLCGVQVCDFTPQTQAQIAGLQTTHARPHAGLVIGERQLTVGRVADVPVLIVVFIGAPGLKLRTD